MTTQCKVGAQGGDKTRPLVRRDAWTLSRRPGPASHHPLLAGRVRNEFTAEEHLLVQQKIEERARRIWIANVCSPQSMLDDWLKAEDAVLAEFVKNLLPCNPGESVPRKPQNNRVLLTLQPDVPQLRPNQVKQTSNTASQYYL